MSDSHAHPNELESAATCPTCGSPLPEDARYCPICGTRVQSRTAYDPDAFKSAVDDVLDDREAAAPNGPPRDATVSSDLDTIPLPVQPGEPIQGYEPEQPPVVTVRGPESSPSAEPTQPSWASSPGDWTVQTPATSGPSAPPPRRERRTLWIILAILGGIVFCCCATFFLLFAVSAADSSFQGELSLLSTLL